MPSWASSESKGWKKTTGLQINTHQCPVWKKASSFVDVCVCERAHSVMSDSLQLHDSSVHGIFQARILEWVAISCSR